MEVKTKLVETRVIEIDGKDYRLEDICDLLENLGMADGVDIKCEIYDPKIKEMAVSKGIAIERGNYYVVPGENFKAFEKEVHEAIYRSSEG